MASLERALLLLCTSLAALQYQCHAFSPLQSSLLGRPTQMAMATTYVADVPVGTSSRGGGLILFGKDQNVDNEERTRPNMVVIKSHEEYINFLEEDDRVCVIKFYANWCKSCQRFGKSFRHLAFEEGDRVNNEGSIIHSGNARFAEVEYSAAAKLCKSLRVKRLPTVHMYRRGNGKLVDMTCKPSLFHLVTEQLNRLLDCDLDLEEVMPLQSDEMQMEKNANITSTSFDGLANEIMISLKKGDKVGAHEQNKSSWFPFTF